VLVPATLLTSLCFYVGYTYTDRFYEQFGVSSEGVGLSTSDYVIRSLNVLVEPLPLLAAACVVLALTGVSLAWLSGVLSRGAGGDDPKTYRRANLGQLVIGLSILAVGVFLIGAFWNPGFDAGTAYVRAGWWLAGVVLAGWGFYLAFLKRRVDGRPSPVSTRLLRSPTVATLAVCFYTLVVAFGTFQVARLYAFARADLQALDTERSCSSFAYARVFSTVDLGLQHLDLEHRSVDRGPGGFGHSYGLFRLFLHDNGRYLLWPANRSPREGMLLIAESDSIRVEASPQLLTTAEHQGYVCPSTQP
jgi:hypothetical protein